MSIESVPKEKLLSAFKEAVQTNDVAFQNAIAAELSKREQPEEYIPTNMKPSDIVEELMSGLGGALSTARGAGQEQLQAMQQGQINPRAALARTGAEGLIPAAVESFMGLGKAVRRTAGSLTPDVIEKPIGQLGLDTLQKATNFIENSDLAQEGLNLLNQSFSAFEDWKRSSPEAEEAGRTLKNIVDITAIALPATKVSPITTNIGPELIKTGRKQKIADRKQAVLEMLEPVIPEEGRGKVTTEGFLQTKTYNPSDIEVEERDVISSIPAIKPEKSFTYNARQLEKEIGNLREKLDNRIIAKGNPKADKKTISIELSNVLDDLLESPRIISAGSSPAFAKNIAQVAQDLLEKSDGTTLGLLNVRRDLDKWLKSNSPAVFNADFENAKRTVLREVRRVLNGNVAAAVPDVNVENLLRRQSLIYRGLDEILPKAQSEWKNAIGRSVVNTQRSLGIRVPQTAPGIAATAGIIGTASLSGIGPVLAGTGAAVFGAYQVQRMVLSGNAKIAVGKLISSVDKALKITENTLMRKQLKADRLVLIDFMNNYQEPEPVEDEAQ
jgi:hypothetical protein